MDSLNTGFWSRLEGRAVNAHLLKTLLGGSDNHATYAAEYGEDARPAVVKAIDARRRATHTQLARWAKVSQLSHPNLISVLDYGECTIDSVRLLYIVTECPEDNLAGVLAVRPLSPSETREMLEPLVAAIGYLHEKGLVHAAIQPSNILAIGDVLKLSSDSITPAGDVNAGHEASVYGPPESNPGVASFPGDVWSLGMTLVEALTQRVPGPQAQGAAHQNLPDPFSDIVRHCLTLHPDARWTIAQVGSRLHGPAPPAVLAPVQSVKIERQPRQSRAPLPKWLLPAGGAILALIALFMLFMLWQNRPASVSPAPEIPHPAAAAPPARSSAPEPKTEPPARVDSVDSVDTRADGATAGHGWFVVVATYTQRQLAEERVAELKQQWPDFNPEVYPPGKSPFYLVILGNDISQQAASTLQAEARAAGLPRDTYITNRPAKR